MFREVTSSLLVCLTLVTATVGCKSISSSDAANPAQTDLEAMIEVPSTLTTGETVTLRFTLTNNTDTKLYVLTWYTPLEGIAGEIFRVERDGQAVPYKGILATRSVPSADAYVLLGPGGSASAEVDLAPAYDFSRAGTYTIEFLSPTISHVARTETEMATSFDDLGPIQMPANTVTVRIAGTADSSDRRTPMEAEHMVRDYLRSQKPNLSPEFHLPMSELPVPEVWEHLPVQIFRVSEGPFAGETFLIRDGIVLPLGTAVGGEGVTSMRVSDLDQDGSAELLFAYSFGSGIHQSRIAMYAPAHAENRIYEAGTAYLGDVGLVKETMSQVAVRVVDPDDESLILRYSDTLGHLTIQRQENDVALVLQVAADLPDDVRRNLVRVPAEGGDGAYPVLPA